MSYTEFRPWGSFTQYTKNEQTTVKTIVVNPMQKLSVQRHQHRDELWVGLDEGLIATIDGIPQRLVGELLIKRGTTHTVENRGHSPAKFLEISFGTFDENDIERLEDKYGRV